MLITLKNSEKCAIEIIAKIKKHNDTYGIMANERTNKSLMDILNNYEIMDEQDEFEENLIDDLEIFENTFGNYAKAIREAEAGIY